jgi:hypothetical protein
MKTLTIALLLIFPGVVAIAQTGAGAPAPVVAPMAMPMPRVIAEVSAGTNSTVKGAPFSAEGVSESVQTLADGNRIVRRWSEKLYRSSDGKFRREGTGAPGSAFGSYVVGNLGITVLDPVGGFRYYYNTDSKTVRETPYRSAPIILNGQGQTIYGQAGAVAGDKATTIAAQKAVIELRARTADGGQDITPTVKADLEAVAAAKARLDEAKVTLATTALPAMPGVPAVPAMPGQKWETRTEQLGVQNFDGVDAEGTRTITTIPADAIGNERPIEIVYERWYSKELQMIVYSKHSDPRFGEQIYRLTNINRSEPDPSLFTVPEGYKVVSDAGPSTYRLAQPRKAVERTVPVKNVATTTVTKP